MEQIVITGGPGSGKTTTIKDLNSRGFETISETARELFEELGTDFDDTLDGFLRFQELITKRQLAKESQCLDGKIHFLDRGLLDNLAYLRNEDIENHTYRTKQLKTVIQNNTDYHEDVFLLNILPSIEEDGVRDEGYEEAKRIETHIETVYEEHGYTIHRVPVLPVQERSEYILDTIL